VSDIDINDRQPDEFIDLSGLNCPLPILKTKAALARLASNQLLEVKVTNPDSDKEFRALGNQPGYQVVAHDQGDGVVIYRVLKC